MACSMPSTGTAETSRFAANSAARPERELTPNIGATALAQRRNGCTRVSARTKNQGASGRPVLLGNLIRKIQGNRHNRAALGAKRRVLTYLTSRMRCMLK